MSIQEKINQKRNEYLYEPKYSDRYIQHLEALSKDKSEANKVNSDMAETTFKNLNLARDLNRHNTECIRELKEQL